MASAPSAIQVRLLCTLASRMASNAKRASPALSSINKISIALPSFIIHRLSGFYRLAIECAMLGPCFQLEIGVAKGKGQRAKRKEQNARNHAGRGPEP